jgi:hypothetical protein
MNILVLGQGICEGRGLPGPTREQRFAQHLAREHRVTLAFVTDDQDCGGRIGALREAIADIEFAVLPRGWQTLAAAARLLAGAPAPPPPPGGLDRLRPGLRHHREHDPLRS